MKSLITKTCLITAAAVMLAQPVMAQSTTPADSIQNTDTRSDAPPAPNLRPYSQTELRRAYEQGRADQAKDMARDNGYPSPVRAGREPAGYCYQRQASARATGTIVGAVLGGVVGSQIGKSSVKCYNGAYYAYRQGQYYSPPPAPDGYQVLYFRDRPQSGYYDNVYYDAPSSRYSQQDDNRYNSVPYSDNSDYQSRPYDNSPQPYSRYDNNGPDRPYVDDRYNSGSQYGSDRPSNADEGWRDDQGQWHYGRPRAVGWQDDDGRWHIGQVVAYGWRDRNGGWHEESSSYSSNSYSNSSYSSSGY